MAPIRCFLDWSAPVTERVCKWLLPDKTPHAVDLSNTLVIVPTRQAGRRLREALALQCAEHGSALIPPAVKEPLFFTHADPRARIAGPLLSNALWTRLLSDIDPADYAGLFPAPPPRRDLVWASRTAEHVQRVRNTLVEGGYLIRDVVTQHGDTLDEPERWADLARLEADYLGRLDKANLADRSAHLIRQAESPRLPPGIRRVVVASVPDPSLLMIRALSRLPGGLPVSVLVHAPDGEANAFDEWGRPLREAWRERLIDIPDAARNIHLGSTPMDQSRITLQAIAEEAARIGPSDLAIGVPDPDVAPYVDTQLAEHGLIAFNPAGVPVKQHRLYHALDACRALFADPTYRTTANLLRHPDVLLALQAGHDVDPAQLLTKLDEIQNRHLPQTLDDLKRVSDTQHPTPDTRHALAFIDNLLACGKQDSLATVITSVMERIYSNQTINPQIPEDDAFRNVASRINLLVEETRDPLFASLNLTAPDALELVLRALAVESWYEERKDAQIDLEGWLELPWNNARLLIVTGMNDGMVPDSRISDVFLPDALLDTLGLRSDADRLARDAYLMSALIESRRREGRVCFIAGACGRGGDPLRPSRLLFRCEDADLPDRAALLFRDPEPNVLVHPASVSFKLDPLRERELVIPESLGVTSFSAYLKCPFRFYLRHVLRMEELRDDKAELDALDFGSLVHYALQGLRDDPACDDESALIALFVGRAETRLRERFGARPPLPVQIQFESVKQRLIAVAAEQIKVVQAGWIPKYFEQGVETTVGGIRIKGKIDRADFHPDRKTWRIIDYKTKDQREPPDKSHIGTARETTPDYALVPIEKGKPKQWHDLQLPLYAVLFRTLEPNGPVSVAHFQLPRAVTDTGLDVWDTLSDDLLQSAWDCAKGVVADIEAGVFWPPADKVDYDHFETLFPFPATQSVAWSQKVLHKDRRGREVQKGHENASGL